MNMLDFNLSDLILLVGNQLMNHVCELIDGGRYTCTPAWYSDGRLISDCHRCYFPIRGAAEMTIASLSHQISPGKIYMIPARQRVAYNCRRRLELDWVHFRLNNPQLDAALVQRGGVMTWPVAHWRFWQPLYKRMQEAIAHRSRQLILQLDAMLLYEIAALVGTTLDAECEDAEARRWRERLAPAVAYMDQHFRSNPPLAEIAAVSHLSPVYFHRACVRWLGTTPHRYMLQRRMQIARDKLEREQLAVKEAAAAAGYADVFYFSRVFKSAFGVSPGSARRREPPRP